VDVPPSDGSSMSRLLPCAALVALVVSGAIPGAGALLDATPSQGFDAVPVHARAHAERPPVGSTGGFGETTCYTCHTGFEINGDEGTLELLGVPQESYYPGARYSLLVRVRHPELRRAGFQLTARFADGGEEGLQAGVIAPGEGQYLQRPADFLVEYLGHDAGGTRPAAAGEGRWEFQWTAPIEPSGSVVFHVAAVAADGDGSQRGNRVFTLEVPLAPPGS